MTSDNGSFSFRRLAPGTYTVVIDGEKDYEPVSERVQIIQPMRSSSGPEQVYPVQIKLKLRTTSESKSGVVNSELANVPKRALDFYNKALELAKGGDSKGAIGQLQRAVSEYSTFMLAFNELGVQYLRLGELEKAEESLRSALKIEPDAFAPLLNHGIALVRLRRFKEAEPELRSALKQREQSAIGHYYLGRALAYQGLFEEAEKELTSAITLGGEEMKEAHRYLAGVYNGLGDRAHAIAELETYLRLAPKSNDAEQIRQLIRKLRESNPTRPER
jgi:tetratricopeptide (TPR) repeat protein